MCQCNSQWKNAAEQFVQDHPGSNQAVIVEFLLSNNHCGATNGVYLDELIDEYNQQLNTNLSRETFQHEVLIPLKQFGFICSLPYPGITGGIFIPCNENEIFNLMKQVVSRVESELANILAISQTTSHNTEIQNILQSLDDNRIN